MREYVYLVDREGRVFHDGAGPELVLGGTRDPIREPAPAST